MEIRLGSKTEQGDQAKYEHVLKVANIISQLHRNGFEVTRLQEDGEPRIIKEKGKKMNIWNVLIEAIKPESR